MQADEFSVLVSALLQEVQVDVRTGQLDLSDVDTQVTELCESRVDKLLDERDLALDDVDGEAIAVEGNGHSHVFLVVALDKELFKEVSGPDLARLEASD